MLLQRLLMNFELNRMFLGKILRAGLDWSQLAKHKFKQEKASLKYSAISNTHYAIFHLKVLGLIIVL